MATKKSKAASKAASKADALAVKVAELRANGVRLVRLRGKLVYAHDHSPVE